MKKIIVHISDIHFVNGEHENIGAVMRGFRDDLKAQIGGEEVEKYLIISGDIAKAGSDSLAYGKFLDYMCGFLGDIGITKNETFCVPGNHDINSSCIKKNLVGNRAIFGHVFDEGEFNDWLGEAQVDIFDKFGLFNESMGRLTNYLMSPSSVGGFGVKLNEDIGIYLLNSAVFSVGGIAECGSDFGRLCVDTRGLNKWLNETQLRHKILVMHHPSNWLAEEFKIEIERLIEKEFCLVLHGHVHEKKSHISYGGNNKSIVCSSPPLFTSKHDDLGYSLIWMSDDNDIDEIVYRQWSKKGVFVPGVGLVGNETGKLQFNVSSLVESGSNNGDDGGVIERLYADDLDGALSLFSSQPRIWIDRRLSVKSEESNSNQKNNEEHISQEDLVLNPKNVVIKAPPQYGLTCMAKHLVKSAWSATGRKFWLYLDARELKPYKKEIDMAVSKKLSILGKSKGDVVCVVLDSWCCSLKKHDEVLRLVSECFSESFLIVMETAEGGVFLVIWILLK